jgi:hypothetical protein
MSCGVKVGRLAGCVIVAVLCASTAMAAGGGWSIQSVATKGLNEAQLVGVSCASPKSCVSVGVAAGGNGFHGSLAEGWNGKRWTTQRSAVPAGAKSAQPLDVSCVSTKRCMAVGRYVNAHNATVPLAEGWNGKKWIVQRAPIPAGAVRATLRGVACPSKTVCFAGGVTKGRTGKFKTLIERFNGHGWSVQAAPNPSGALGSELINVSCTSPRACIGVGDFVDRNGVVHHLADRWDGSHWSLQQLPAPAAGATRSELVGVWCSVTSDCEAVGYYTAPGTGNPTLGYAAAWNGSSWTIQQMPAPVGAEQFLPLDVSCTSGLNCTATGQAVSPQKVISTLVEQWNGTSWTLQSTPKPRGTSQSLLNAIACTPTGGCTAVGWYSTKRAQLPLIERHG